MRSVRRLFPFTINSILIQNEIQCSFKNINQCAEHVELETVISVYNKFNNHTKSIRYINHRAERETVIINSIIIQLLQIQCLFQILFHKYSRIFLMSHNLFLPNPK